MADREKVMNGLELCEIGSGDRCYETECPYYGQGCTEDLKNDILELLKEQEEEIESLKQTAQSMMEGVCLLKEQKPVPLIHGAGYEEYWDVESICPKCDARWISLTEDHFCPQCGQAVKWE